MYRDKHARRTQTASTRAEALPPPSIMNIHPFEPAALRMAR
jgi:hypothetical protein